MRSTITLMFLLAATPLAAQQLSPPTAGGIAEIDQALSRLAQNKRVLLIGAHPDDENTELLALLSRGMGVDAAYLSLSRGEGGQNLIGQELGEALGIIRTGELLAARSVDGARQYFTRGFDFGFSRTLDETLRFWPPDSILADVVRVMRRFQPQIVITVFRGTPRDGHGQHQMSGVIGQQAFALLRDSAWGPKKLYRMALGDTAGITLRLRSGLLDPVTGRSIGQIAGAGRSQHRSQDMGTLQRLGFSEIGLVGTHGQREGREGSLFEGVDTTLGPGLERYSRLIDSARTLVNARGLERVVPVLLDALGELRRHGSTFFRSMREAPLQRAIAAAAGIVVDAAADDGQVAGGQPLNVVVSVWNAGPVASRVASAVVLAPADWASRAMGDSTAAGVRLTRFVLTPPAGAVPTAPYFMQRPKAGALYDWSMAPDDLRGEALDPPLLEAVVQLDIAGTMIELRREVSWRYNDQASGEVRKPVAVVPAVGVTLSPSVLLWPAGNGTARTVAVELIHGARGRSTGEVVLQVPEGWPAVPAQRFTLDGEGTRRSFFFEVRAPRSLRPGSWSITAQALTAADTFDRASLTIDYSHIRPVTTVHQATLRAESAPLALPRVRVVGFVRGAGDAMPEALASVGLPVEVLSSDALERADLSRYDVVVVGSRAYETDPSLVANNGRLLDWARAGGRLIVLYQQYQFIQGGFAPFRLTIARPHDRVTDEHAPVTALDPAHPLFNRPNRITETDWSGWVQERGLYFPREWDAAYRPLLETGDAGERLRGGVLVARLGNGLYVYTGLSFFRQLPAAVPGAFRLFMNLLAMEAGDVR